jgi:hypothetical protein
MLDTGASTTLVPRELIRELGEDNLLYIDVEVFFPGLPPETHKAYVIGLLIEGGCTFEELEVIPLDIDYVIIGRDVINRYKIVLDGPNNRWEVEG